MISGVERKQCQQVLQIDEIMRGQEAETYISFITDNRKSISNSIYTGKKTILTAEGPPSS